MEKGDPVNVTGVLANPASGDHSWPVNSRASIQSDARCQKPAAPYRSSAMGALLPAWGEAKRPLLRIPSRAGLCPTWVESRHF